MASVCTRAGLGAGEVLQLARRRRSRTARRWRRDQPADALDHQFGAGRVGELGEHDHQRAPLEPGGQRRQRQREIGLLGTVVERGGGGLQPVERAGVRRRTGSPPRAARQSRTAPPGRRLSARHRRWSARRRPRGRSAAARRPARTSPARNRTRRRSGCCARSRSRAPAAGCGGAEVFQSIRRRSMPGWYSASASNCVPSPRMRRATRPNCASRRKSAAPGSAPATRSGQTRTACSARDRACRAPRPSGPAQRSHSRAIGAAAAARRGEAPPRRATRRPSRGERECCTPSAVTQPRIERERGLDAVPPPRRPREVGEHRDAARLADLGIGGRDQRAGRRAVRPAAHRPRTSASSAATPSRQRRSTPPARAAATSSASGAASASEPGGAARWGRSARSPSPRRLGLLDQPGRPAPRPARPSISAAGLSSRRWRSTAGRAP